MALALNKVWRRHRLAQHGLDPKLVDEINREKNAHIHDAYVAKYGPRPEEAKWQSNSSLRSNRDLSTGGSSRSFEVSDPRLSVRS